MLNLGLELDLDAVHSRGWDAGIPATEVGRGVEKGTQLCAYRW